MTDETRQSPTETVSHGYTADHDRKIVAMRRDGKSVREIAATVTEEFGIARTPHSIDVRLKMLAAYDGGPEDGL